MENFALPPPAASLEGRVTARCTTSRSQGLASTISPAKPVCCGLQCLGQPLLPPEYCHLPQVLQEAAFHIDHVSPRSGRGPSQADNLALACVTCSLKKAARTHARDPQTKELVPLFHPRHDRWSDHFETDAAGDLLGSDRDGDHGCDRPPGWARPLRVINDEGIVFISHLHDRAASRTKSSCKLLCLCDEQSDRLPARG